MDSTSASQTECGSGSSIGSVFAAAGLPPPTAQHYPKHSDLPWHFSFIDSDGMIGGSSAPTERKHWRALDKLGVGLVVNLTEAAISPPRNTPRRMDSELLFGFESDDLEHQQPQQPDEYSGQCSRCSHADDSYDPDLFADVQENNINVLFLPIPDGSVPRFEQIDVFLREANKSIQAGKKVIVHCQAGVGRTGTFLAIYLINKYQLDPLMAITLLRHYRPQSLQFHSTDWQVDPFRLHPDPKAYNRNMVQERFVERWWHAMMRERRRVSISQIVKQREVSPIEDGPAANDNNTNLEDLDDSVQHRNKRRTSFVMDTTRLIPEDDEEQVDINGVPVKTAVKTRRRHTDSAATYDNFMEYLVALSKQQPKQEHHLSPVNEVSPTPTSTPTTATSPVSFALNSTPMIPQSVTVQTSILSSSLSATSAYPTPPRTGSELSSLPKPSMLSSSFKRTREDSTPFQDDVSPSGTTPLGTSFPKSSIGFNASSFNIQQPQPPSSPLSTSFTESFQKLSSSSPSTAALNAALSSTSATSTHPVRPQHPYHQRKRHPKPILSSSQPHQHQYHHNHSQSQQQQQQVPKTTAFAIAPVLLKLIDQQLDSKFTAFTASPCVSISPSTATTSAAAVRVIHATGPGLPSTREHARKLCYGCRGVVVVGPEPIVPVPVSGTSSQSSAWPCVVPFPSHEDAPAAVSPAGRGGGLFSSAGLSPAAAAMIAGGGGLSGVLVGPPGGNFGNAWASAGGRRRLSSLSIGTGLIGTAGGDEMSLDENGGVAGNLGVVGSAASDYLNGAVEALHLEEAQRREVSLAVRNRIV